MQHEKRNACSDETSGVGGFLGSANRNIEYLIATKDGIVSCSTVRTLPDNEEVDIKYTDYVKTGSRTAPIAARFTPPANALAPDPNPIPTIVVPRVACLKSKDFTFHGRTGGCKGCEHLATDVGRRKKPTV